MIDTKELAKICGVSLKTITIWAKKNEVKKNGYRWDFSPDDCRKLFSRYNVEENEAAFTLQMNPLTENEKNEPLDEFYEPSNEEEFSSPSSFSNENESFEPQNKALIDVLKETIDVLRQQLEVKDNQLDAKNEQIRVLLETNAQLSESMKQLSAANSVQIVADKRDFLLTDNQNQEKTKKKKGFFSRLFGD